MVTPNHVHGIIILHEDAGGNAARAGSENRSAIYASLSAPFGYASLSPNARATDPQDTLRYRSPLQVAPQ